MWPGNRGVLSQTESGEISKSRYNAAIKLRWRQRTETFPVYDQIIKLSEMGSKVSIPLTLLNLLLMCVTLWSCLNCGIFAKSYRRPNIVFILTDDLDVVIGGLVGNWLFQCIDQCCPWIYFSSSWSYLHIYSSHVIGERCGKVQSE